MKEVEKNLQSATTSYDDFVTAINAEIRARKVLLTALEQADKFYRNQRRDVKKVVYVSVPLMILNDLLEFYFILGLQKFRRTHQADSNGAQSKSYKSTESYTVARHQCAIA